jgi:NADH-quinone oxidoreductase subunit F
MKKIRSIGEFTSFRNAVLNGSENNVPCLIISAGTCGQASGANDIMRMSKRYILEKELQDKIHLRITG